MAEGLAQLVNTFFISVAKEIRSQAWYSSTDIDRCPDGWLFQAELAGLTERSSFLPRSMAYRSTRSIGTTCC